MAGVEGQLWAATERRHGTRVRLTLFRIVLVALYAASFAVIGVLFWGGHTFYLAPLAVRAHHPGYWTWKPAGQAGWPLGVIGSSMMVVMLLYTVRKRIRLFRHWGALARWLDIHIYLGVVGPLLVVLHSSFKVHGLVALSFWSMIAVAVSGVLGRYLYLQIPRTRAGEELALADLEKEDRALGERLRSEFRLDDALLKRLDALAGEAPPSAGLGSAVFGLFSAQLLLPFRLRAFEREWRGGGRQALGELVRVARRKTVVRRRIVFWEALHRLFHYWHVIHKPFAVVMYVFMVVHVVVASMTGYGWAWASAR
jgi:hypothetical protein